MQAGLRQDDKKEILARLQKLEDEVDNLRSIAATGEMGMAGEMREGAVKRPVSKNENLVEGEKVQLMQKPEIKGLFDKIDIFLND